MDNQERQPRTFAQLFEAVEKVNLIMSNWADVMTLKIDTLGFLLVECEAFSVGEPQ